MVGLAEKKHEDQMMSLCTQLFNSWVFTLSEREKEVWLWNAMVEMARIKQRRAV